MSDPSGALAKYMKCLQVPKHPRVQGVESCHCTIADPTCFEQPADQRDLVIRRRCIFPHLHMSIIEKHVDSFCAARSVCTLRKRSMFSLLNNRCTAILMQRLQIDDPLTALVSAEDSVQVSSSNLVGSNLVGSNPSSAPWKLYVPVPTLVV